MHFENLFTVSPTVPDQVLMNLIPKVISDQDNADLLRIPTSDEVWMVVKSMKSNKSPGPDGFPVSFFKHNWALVGNQIVALIQNVFVSKKFDPKLNETFLFLIPKIKQPKSPSDFRPIGLSNTP